MNNETLTAQTMKLNEVAPLGFTSEPRVLSKEVFDLRREVAAMRETLLQLVEVIKRKSESPTTKEAAPISGNGFTSTLLEKHLASWKNGKQDAKHVSEGGP